MKHSQRIKQKICTDQDSLLRKVIEWHTNNKKIVFTNGCFDLLHLGHVDYLAKAADLGDVLIVALNSDASVRRIKGEHRPIQNENARMQIIASLGCVDAVVTFHEDTPYNIISVIKPHILVKGSDYKPQDIVGYDVVVANGGMVHTIDYIDGYSTSLIEKKIKQS
jgi:rfaE bifunctional protein nucleotidyltransferase chain/domain